MKSATTSGVMYACGSPISYTSCSVTDGTLTRPPVSGMLGDDEGAVGARLDDRDSRRSARSGMLRQSYRQLPPGALRAALDDVAGDDARGEPVPVVGAPAELVAQRRHRERGVGRAAGDDDVRAALPAPRRSASDPMYAFADSTRSRIGDERLAGVHVRAARGRRDQLVEARQQVVAGDDADREACPPRRAAARRRAPPRAHAGGFTPPALAMTFTPRSTHRRQHALHRADEVARVAHRRVALLLLLQDGHRDFGEVVEHQVVDRPALDLPPRRVEPVAPEALPDATRTMRFCCVSELMRRG